MDAPSRSAGMTPDDERSARLVTVRAASGGVSARDILDVVVSLLDDLDMPAYVASDGALHRVNRTFAALVGRASGDITRAGFDPHELVAEDDRPTLEQRLRLLGANASSYGLRFQTRLLRDGEEIPVEAAVARLEASGEELSFGILRDLDLSRRRERDSREFATSERNAAVESLANGVSHEIRTPLTSLRTDAHLLLARLERHDASSDEKALAWAILDAVDRIHSALSGLPRSAPAVDIMRPASLQRVVADAIVTLLATSPEAPLDLTLEPTPDVPMDPVQVKQVVMHVVQNALDASDGLAPPVRVRTTTSHDEHGTAVAVIVEDAGPGIPEDVRARMFDPLFTTRAGHQGLGLSIVKRIVERHGGAVACESEPGRGTTFSVMLRERAPDR